MSAEVRAMTSRGLEEERRRDAAAVLLAGVERAESTSPRRLPLRDIVAEPPSDVTVGLSPGGD